MKLMHILQRMRELSCSIMQTIQIQLDDRKEIQKEIDQLDNEIDRIA